MAEAPPVLDAPFVDESHALAVHRLVQDWVAAGSVSGQRAAPVRVSRALGVRVTLRAQGHLLGHGDAWRRDLAAALNEPDAAASTDLVPLIERAAFEAFDHAQTKLRELASDAALDARLRPEFKGAGQVPTLDEMRNVLTVDVQIAHSPRPIVLAPGDIRDEALRRYSPGYHGLLAEDDADGDDTPWIAVWPASALSHNLTPLGQLRQLAKERNDVAAFETDKFGRPNGPRLWRFDNLHAVRPSPGRTVVTLTRGGAVLARAALDQPELRSRSERIAHFLLGRFIGRGTVRGTYLPSADRWDPELATLREAALAAFALVEHGATQRLLSIPDPLAAQTAARLDDLITRAAIDLDAPEAPLQMQPDEAALLLLTRLSLRPPNADPAHENADLARQPGADPIARRLAGMLRAAIDERGGVQRPTSDAEPDAPPRYATRAGTALAAFALGRYGIVHEDADALADAATVTDTLWEHGALNDGNTLPWIAWAHIEFTEPWRSAGLLDADEASRRSASLDDTLNRLEQFQIVAPPPGVPADVLGGFDLPPAPPPAPPRPDWRTAQFLLATSAAMRNESLEAPRGAFARVLTAQAAARFLAQLMLDPQDAYYVRAPELATHGVRPALDDNTLGLSYSAMTLLAFDHLRVTLHQRAAEPEPKVAIE